MSHDLRRVIIPTPHVLLQVDHEVQGDHLPSTKTIKVSLKLVLLYSSLHLNGETYMLSYTLRNMRVGHKSTGPTLFRDRRLRYMPLGFCNKIVTNDLKFLHATDLDIP